MDDWMPHPDVRGWLCREILQSELEDAIERKALIEQRVLHDNWCPLLKGGPCECDFDVAFYELRLGGPEEGAQR